MDGDDWKAGGLALCIDDGPRKRSIAQIDGQWFMEGGDKGTQLKRGCQYVVKSVASTAGVIGLRFSEVRESTSYWLATRFIKITPPEADEFDHEIIDIMNGNPVPAEAS